MRVWFTALITCLLPVLAWAEDSGLERLDTSDRGREWEAVGRLDLNGKGFCTGALIAPDLVLTAAHCLYDKKTRERLPVEAIEFRAGWRNGRAASYRYVRRAVVHPDYVFGGEISSERVRNDVALLELQHPIRNTTVIPFETGARPLKGGKVGVVSYAKDRSEAPSLQEYCAVIARQQGVLVMSCQVDYGSSGAPIFSFDGDKARIVSVVSAKAEVHGERVALGTSLDGPLALLRAELKADRGRLATIARTTPRIKTIGARQGTGAKFVKP